MFNSSSGYIAIETNHVTLEISKKDSKWAMRIALKLLCIPIYVRTRCKKSAKFELRYFSVALTRVGKKTRLNKE